MLYPLEGSHYKQLSVGVGIYVSSPWQQRRYINYLGSLMGDMSFHYHSFITDFSIFSHLLRYSFICISIDSCIFIISYLGLWYNTILLCCSSWPLGTHCIGYCVLLIYTTDEFLLSTFLLSSTKKCSRLILYISCLSPGISHFSKDLWCWRKD